MTCINDELDADRYDNILGPIAQYDNASVSYRIRNPAICCDGREKHVPKYIIPENRTRALIENG